MAVLLHLEDPALPPARGWALWALGFRPFYLMASVLAALSVPIWALQVSGWLDHAVLRGPVWHAHEMLFGFTLAVVVGFLFTAGRNWSDQPTPSGGLLMALALLWLAARLLVLSPWPLAAAAANVAFPLAAAWGLGRALWAGRNRRNYFFVGLLLLLAVAAALVHAVQLGWLVLPGMLGVQAGFGVVLVIIVVMAGRVVPMFTNNGVPGANARRHPVIEQLALASVLALLVNDVVQGAADLAWPALTVVLALLAAGVHAARLGLWQPWATRRNPMVWVLHAAYAWIPLHLLLRAAAAAGWLAPSLATHALTVGAIGAITLGMMTRTARGHTGRPLKADRFDVASYVLVLGGAAARVALPLVMPSAQLVAILGSALLWSAGFTLYALHYGPWLCRPRLDGRPG